MEKLHKYCLSVLLVIICSNISAQIHSGNVGTEDCKELYKFYNQILDQDCCGSQKYCTKRKLYFGHSVQQKKNALELLGKADFDNKYQYPLAAISYSKYYNKQNGLLTTFLKAYHGHILTNDLYFKAKVSKIRNKDYLDKAA